MNELSLGWDKRRLDGLAVVALGGNLPAEHRTVQGLLAAALERFGEAGLTVVAQSGWWCSAAWPDPADPPFVNAVVLAEAAWGAARTLTGLHALEACFGRRRSAVNAPRTLDLDLIAFGRQVRAQPGLTLPHPRAHERAFVMRPLAEIAPGWTHPALGRTAAELALQATIGLDARPCD